MYVIDPATGHHNINFLVFLCVQTSSQVTHPFL